MSLTIEKEPPIAGQPAQFDYNRSESTVQRARDEVCQDAPLSSPTSLGSVKVVGVFELCMNETLDKRRLTQTLCAGMFGIGSYRSQLWLLGS